MSFSSKELATSIAVFLLALSFISSEHRYLPGIAESSAVTNIYGNKIAIVIWTEEPEAIIIENAAAAKAYKSYFDFMWKKTREINKRIN